jgi:phycocyanobilin lyase beta subunit
LKTDFKQAMSVTEIDNTSALIQAVDAADSAGALVQAVRALAAVQDPAAIPTLITILGFNNPGAAVTAVEGLVCLGRAAVPALLAQLDGYNYGARAWAIRALALIGDPQALAILVETAQGDFALSVRRAATMGLGNLRWDWLPTGAVADAQAEALAALFVALGDGEWVVRYAAVVGLFGLAQAQAERRSPGIEQRLTECAIADETLIVRARAHLALRQLGSQPLP